jgi:hypothetical protein
MFGYDEKSAAPPPANSGAAGAAWSDVLLRLAGKLLRLGLLFGAVYWTVATILPIVLAWWFVHVLGSYVPLHPGMEAALGMVAFAIFTKYGFQIFVGPKSAEALAWVVLAICGAIGLNIARTGTVTFAVDKKFYAMTDRGPVFSDEPGVDGESGQPLVALTPERRRLLRRMLTQERMRIDPERSDLFDGLTGEPIAFWLERDGEMEFYNAPGFDTRAGVWLRPVSNAVMLSYQKRRGQPAGTPLLRETEIAKETSADKEKEQ